jgi:hypothetical protein
VFLVSDFISPQFTAPLRVAARRHDLVAITLGDPREKVLPDVGLIELEDAESGKTVLIDTSHRETREVYKKEMARLAEERTQVFRKTGVDEILVSTETDYMDPLVRFFRKRERLAR